MLAAEGLIEKRCIDGIQSNHGDGKWLSLESEIAECVRRVLGLRGMRTARIHFLENSNPLLFAIFKDFEISSAQVMDMIAGLVGDNRGDLNENRLRFERELAFFISAAGVVHVRLRDAPRCGGTCRLPGERVIFLSQCTGREKNNAAPEDQQLAAHELLLRVRGHYTSGLESMSGPIRTTRLIRSKVSTGSQLRIIMVRIV